MKFIASFKKWFSFDWFEARFEVFLRLYLNKWKVYLAASVSQQSYSIIKKYQVLWK